MGDLYKKKDRELIKYNKKKLARYAEQKGRYKYMDAQTRGGIWMF